MRVGNKLVLATLVAGIFGIGAVSVQAASVSLSGGDSSQWSIIDNGTTSNGLPSGGTCTSGADGIGATITDANVPAGGDAFDYGGMVWVNNTLVGGNLSTSGNTVTFSPVSISGLNAQMVYEVLTTSATLRVLTTLENPTANPIVVPVNYVTNFGSDSTTQVRGSSSGDTSFTSADNWVVTSDSGDSDAVNTTVIFGAGAAPVTPTSVSQTVFSCAGTEGVQANYNISVPAGATIALMFFQQLSDTSPNALIEAVVFDNPSLNAELLFGLSENEMALIQNWDLGAVVQVAPPVVPVPTMSVYGLLVTMLALLWVAFRRLRAPLRDK